ncbi:MAG: hypothetical protein LBT29_03300, partial [Flavobacteriaceae bacterium]|nr:hypothetical protein [Flavobacteriaceae bacterium]
DKIFIISSIFGGTGASGFPLLRRVLHTQNIKTANGQELMNWGQINEAPLGAITVLPYFSVKEKKVGDDSFVDSNTFIDKAKAALSYYVTEDKHLDTMYYIGDKNVRAYEHEKGGTVQRNDAHFVELAAALAVLDFVNPNKTAENFHRNNNEIVETTYKEFGIVPNGQAGDVSVISFANLADETKRTLINPLTRFLLFHKYLKKIFENQYKKQPYARKNAAHQRFDEKFINTEIIKKVTEVQDRFFDWLVEMENQTRQFAPFILEDDGKFNFIRDNINAVRKSLLYKNWALLDNELNRQAPKINKELTDEGRFLELFYRATEKVINFKN